MALSLLRVPCRQISDSCRVISHQGSASVAFPWPSSAPAHQLAPAPAGTCHRSPTDNVLAWGLQQSGAIQRRDAGRLSHDLASPRMMPHSLSPQAPQCPSLFVFLFILLPEHEAANETHYDTKRTVCNELPCRKGKPNHRPVDHQLSHKPDRRSDKSCAPASSCERPAVGCCDANEQSRSEVCDDRQHVWYVWRLRTAPAVRSVRERCEHAGNKGSAQCHVNQA